MRLKNPLLFMRQLFFISFIFSYLACTDAEKREAKTDAGKYMPEITDTVFRVTSHNDGVKFPYSTEQDSGYFSGYIPEQIDSLEAADTSMLFKALSGIIRKKDMVLLSNQTLSHSVSINQKNKTRNDTLKNAVATITSVYRFSGQETQIISINGKPVKQTVKAGDGDYVNDLAIDIDQASFRHFSFKGRAYYYMYAGVIDHGYGGGSIGNLNFHLLYDIEAGKLSIFTTCRWGRILLFGDINGDDRLDFLDFNNDDFCTSIPYSDTVKLSLYSCDKKGSFVLQKDAAGNPYYIKANTGYQYRQDSLNIKKYYWPVPITQ
jgi:hypothetical protein